MCCTDHCYTAVLLLLLQVFEQVECDASGCIHEAEWESAWHNFPELLDMMSLSGMSKIVLFATEIARIGK
jgi:hypothetical protein